MKVLIADDDPVFRRVLEVSLAAWGYEVLSVGNGIEACAVLQKPDAPRLVILNWMMPELDGIDVCRRVRARSTATPPYLILLTGRGHSDDIVTGLNAGANDYITKPFDREELRARVGVGVRVLELQANLAARVQELEEALKRVRQLQKLLPICSHCKKIRNDQNYWQQVEGYISEHTDVQFSHGICPECLVKLYPAHAQRIVSTAPETD
ncbi:MAG: response regulator [Candidatus Acidiferrales bacterium]